LSGDSNSGKLFFLPPRKALGPKKENTGGKKAMDLIVKGGSREECQKPGECKK